MGHDTGHIKTLPHFQVKKMLRDRGFPHPVGAVAAIAGVHQSHVSKVLRKRAVSDPVWGVIADMIAGRVRPVEEAGVV